MANNAFYGENSDVSAILFDLDNTLIQTRKGDTRACNKVRKSHPQKKFLTLPRSWIFVVRMVRVCTS